MVSSTYRANSNRIKVGIAVLDGGELMKSGSWSDRGLQLRGQQQCRRETRTTSSQMQSAALIGNRAALSALLLKQLERDVQLEDEFGEPEDGNRESKMEVSEKRDFFPISNLMA